MNSTPASSSAWRIAASGTSPTKAKLPTDIPSDGFLGEQRMKPPVAANDNIKPVKLLRYCDLSETRGIRFSRRHLKRLEDENKFPKRVVLGENSIGWPVAEIDEWLAAKLGERYAA
jgi:predicted DNA-binding transcriptional regulator AlpA